MTATDRNILWWLGAALSVFAFVIVVAPSFMAPLFDSAVSIGGPPAGLVVMAAFWLTISVVGLVAIRLAHRADARLGIAVGIVVLATIVLFLEPTLILVIQNPKV